MPNLTSEREAFSLWQNPAQLDASAEQLPGAEVALWPPLLIPDSWGAEPDAEAEMEVAAEQRCLARR